MEYREFIKKGVELGLMHEVQAEVDWNLEAGAICSMRNRVDAPRPIFRNIKGFPKGFSLAGDLYAGSWRKPWNLCALALGLDPDIEYVAFLEEAAKRLAAPIKPTIVTTGPCKEVIRSGKEVDLFSLPWPYIHDGDGGRYGTIASLIAKDLDSDWVNWANYRHMVLTRNKIAQPFQPGQQTANMFLYKYEPRGQRMPVCIAYGGDTTSFLTAGAAVPPGVSEVDVAGGLLQKPVELVPAETNDLYVPANAEIVIEGEILPGERAWEGPMGEYIGYIAGPRNQAAVIRVNAITHRKDPIFPFTCCGSWLDDNASVLGTFSMAPIYTHLKYQVGWPVTSVHISSVFGTNSIILIATEVPYKGYVHDLGSYMFTPGVMAYLDYVALLDADVDLTDAEQVVEEIMLKAHPVRDFHNVGKHLGPKSHLNVYQTNEEKRARTPTSKIYIDATTKEWDEKARGPKRMNFDTLYPRSLQDQIEKSWKSLRFTDRIVFK